MAAWVPTGPPELTDTKPTKEILYTEVAGESLSYLTPVYKSADDGKWYKSDANDSTRQACQGVTLSGAGADDYVLIHQEGIITSGGVTVTVGTLYVVSASTGIDAESALTTGDRVIVVGVGATSSTLDVKIWNTGYDKP